MLQDMGLQRVGHSIGTEQQQEWKEGIVKKQAKTLNNQI